MNKCSAGSDSVLVFFFFFFFFGGFDVVFFGRVYRLTIVYDTYRYIEF